MSDPGFNSKYQKYKYRVKSWERKFHDKFKRIPSKHDIKDASIQVREAYKMYYKMKTSILEDKLSDVLSDEEDFDFSVNLSQTDSLLSGSVNSSISELLTLDMQDLERSSSSISFSNIDEIKNSNIPISTLPSDFLNGDATEFEASSTDANESKWGAHLNKKVDNNKKKTEPGSKLNLKLPEKLRQSASFSLRNPRKPLNRIAMANSANSSSNLQGNLRESLPDLETILMQKSKKINDETISENSLPSSGGPTSCNKLVNNIDQGWLQRCSSANSLETVESMDTQLKRNLSSNFGLSNINLSAIERGSLANSSNSSTSFGLSKLNLASSMSSIPGDISSSNVSTFSYSENTYDRPIHTDDEEIENSEDESASRHIIKRRKVEEVKKIEKQMEVACSPEANSSSNITQNKINTIESKTVEEEPKPARKSKDSTVVKKVEKISAPAQQRTSRRSNKKALVKYSDETSNDFDADDSDADPDFNIKSVDKKNTLKAFQHLPEIDEDQENIVEEKKRVKKVTKKKSVAAKPPKVGLVGKIRKQASKLIKSKKTRKSSSPVKEITATGDADNTDYVLEFGIDSIHNAPRIDLSEFKDRTKAFENYIHSGNDGAQNNIRVEKAASAEHKENAKRVMKKNLNENFVRINMKKKVFVRGHKTINFSRYKKSLWKQKKIASLSGPDMDMGGCDGGVLTCHLCGNVGHFARNCKIRSEELLPLDAAEADSAFPTLEEAEEMAKSKVLVVHATRPENLPATSNTILKEKILSNVNMTDDEETDNVSIETEPEDMAEEIITNKKTYIGHTIPDDFIKKSGILEFTVGNKDKIDPVYSLNPDGSTKTVTQEVHDALAMFGHLNFRKGQDKAIMRILSGLSTLVTLSTGSGKSLCYQLPAYIYSQQRNCITLVISPLVSLMEDQVDGVPDFLNAQCLHTNQTPKQREKIMASIKAGKLNILLVSPEAVVAGEKSSGFGSLLKQLPPIAFACIDEAHCVSQWSHNFRPSYLMLCRVLKEKLGVSTILGLTATATLPTRTSIVQHLKIPDGLSGIISDIPLPDNLLLTVSKDVHRDTALLELLRSDRFSDCQSIIIYCTRRDECERIAAFLRTCLQDNKPAPREEDTTKRKKKKINWNAEPYHAGLAASRRRTIQNAFMSGDLRIVIATIAFGMGINKSDIRAIIHYNMPKNFESYVQEVGRAGRDGKLAHCHLFLDSKGNDKSELRRHIYANSIDRHVIRKLLQKIFIQCACAKNFKNEVFSKEHQENIDALKDISWSDDMMETSTGEIAEAGGNSMELYIPKKRICPGHEVCFSIESTVQLLDIPEENIATLLCYLELHEERYIHVLSRAYTQCKVMSYGGPRQLKLAAQTCPPLAMAIALDLKKGISHNESTFIEFPVIDVAAAIGWDSGVVKYQLKNLEWTTVNGFKKRSTISVIYSDLGFRIRAPGDLTDDELDGTLDLLHKRVSNQEKKQLTQLQCVFDALSSVSFNSYLPCSKTDCSTEPSEKLKSIIREYFQNDCPADIVLENEINHKMDGEIISDIRTMITRYPENNFTGRTLARIFHGVQSPNFPAVIWGRCKYWRAHTKIDFNHIVALANCEIVKMRIK